MKNLQPQARLPNDPSLPERKANHKSLLTSNTLTTLLLEANLRRPKKQSLHRRRSQRLLRKRLQRRRREMTRNRNLLAKTRQQITRLQPRRNLTAKRRLPLRKKLLQRIKLLLKKSHHQRRRDLRKQQMMLRRRVMTYHGVGVGVILMAKYLT